MKRLLMAMLFAATRAADAQVLATTPGGVIAAYEGRIELHDQARLVWSTSGVDHPSAIAVGTDRVAVIDSWMNGVRIVRLRDGQGQTRLTGETPAGAIFVGDDLYVLERDARMVTWFGPAGSTKSVQVAPDAAFLRESNGKLYVYGRLHGTLQEIAAEGSRTRIERSMTLPASASDLEISGRTAYLVYPRSAKLVAVNLERLEITSEAEAGGVPTDLAIVSGGSALTAPQLAIADPAAKRVWVSEGAQSVGGAFGRGFLRGLLGLGLFRPRSSELPRGADRVMSASGVTLAYDTTTGTLYRTRASGMKPIAEGIEPQAFTITAGRIAVWTAGGLRYHD